MVEAWHVTLIVGITTLVASVVMYLIGRLHQSSRYERMADTRLTKLETQMQQVDEQRMEDRKQMDERIFRMAELSEEVLRVCRKVMDQNTVLIAEIRADRGSHPRLSEN